MGAGRASAITGAFYNKHENGRRNIQEKHEPNQASEKKNDRNKDKYKNENKF